MLPTTFLISVASSGPLTQKLTSLLKIGFRNFYKKKKPEDENPPTFFEADYMKLLSIFKQNRP